MLVLLRELFVLLRELLVLLRELFVLLRELLVLLFNHFVSVHDGGVTVLYSLEILVLNIHILTELGINRGHHKPMENVLHVSIILIVGFVKLHNLPVVFFLVGLVKHAEHLFQPVIDLSVQKRNLDNDAVMDEAVNKRVREALRHLMAFIVVGFMVDIEYGHVNLSYSMPKDIHRHHGNTIGRVYLFAYHILRVCILCTEILPEAQRLRFQPCFLQLNED